MSRNTLPSFADTLGAHDDGRHWGRVQSLFIGASAATDEIFVRQLKAESGIKEDLGMELAVMFTAAARMPMI